MILCAARIPANGTACQRQRLGGPAPPAPEPTCRREAPGQGEGELPGADEPHAHGGCSGCSGSRSPDPVPAAPAASTWPRAAQRGGAAWQRGGAPARSKSVGGGAGPRRPPSNQGRGAWPPARRSAAIGATGVGCCIIHRLRAPGATPRRQAALAPRRSHGRQRAPFWKLRAARPAPPVPPVTGPERPGRGALSPRRPVSPPALARRGAGLCRRDPGSRQPRVPGTAAGFAE